MAPEVPHEERASGQAEEVDQRLDRHRRRRARVEALLQVEEHVEQPEEDERAPRRDAGEHGPRAPADEADRRGGGRACHPRVRGQEGVLEGDVGIRLARVERVAGGDEGGPVGCRPGGGDGEQGGHGGCGGWTRRAHAGAAVPACPAGASPTGPGGSIASARYAPVTSHAVRQETRKEPSAPNAARGWSRMTAGIAKQAGVGRVAGGRRSRAGKWSTRAGG